MEYSRLNFSISLVDFKNIITIGLETHAWREKKVESFSTFFFIPAETWWRIKGELGKQLSDTNLFFLAIFFLHISLFVTIRAMNLFYGLTVFSFTVKESCRHAKDLNFPPLANKNDQAEKTCGIFDGDIPLILKLREWKTAFTWLRVIFRKKSNNCSHGYSFPEVQVIINKKCLEKKEEILRFKKRNETSANVNTS